MMQAVLEADRNRRPAPPDVYAGVYAEVRAERARQDARWGGPPHDDTLSHEQWLALLTELLGNAAANRRPVRGKLWRIILVELAATAVAAAEAYDRAEAGDWKY